VRHKANVEYQGVIERASDGFTVLSLGGRKRVHNVQVGEVYAITFRGVRHVLQTPPERWRIRSAEIRRIVEGFTEEWAEPYFDITSSQHFKAQPDHRDLRDNDAERLYRRRVLGEMPSRKPVAAPTPSASGCALVLCAGLALALSGCALIWGGG